MNRFRPGSNNTLLAKHKRIKSGVETSAKPSMRYMGKPDMEGGRSTTNDWNEIFNASSHNVEDLQEKFLHELETKENEIRVLRY